MKLCYRGVEYDYNPPMLEVSESELMGTYRGCPTQFSYVRHLPIPQPVAELTYRGHTYRTTSRGRIEQITQKPESIFQKLKALARPANPMAKARRTLLQEAAKIHQQNIHQNLLHRLQVAREQGNERLVHLLEDEMHQLA
ncbi:MAG: DUF4278 domain-containing protein [Leptolyngbyaceae cyanobacterium MO_188.B28]|nr:DUF4278 domain-containing protein [Leptolyngbyaceae cyanobacterium MO_188.B28]